MGIVRLNVRMNQDISDPSHFDLHLITSSSEQTAVNLLAENCPLSRQVIKSTMKNGAVWLESDIGTHRLRRAKKNIRKGNIIHFYYDEKIQRTMPEEAELIADETGYSIWNKPGGMYSQGSKWGDHCTIYRWAATHLNPQRPTFLVHRLDRAANGLIIIAHSKKMAKIFSDLFKNREIQKSYKAIVEGKLDELTLPYIIDKKIDDKPAVSKITAVEQDDEKASVTVEIETGRKHQIRKHLSGSGFPIVGDRLYGSGRSDENLQLQSYYLKFRCPISNEIMEYSL